MNCPGCGAPMRLEVDKDYLVCDYCGTIHVAAANDDGVQVLDAAAGAECPVCAVPLFHAAVAGQRIFYCQRCRGMLVPMDIFALLVEDLRSRREKTAGIVYPLNPKGLDRRLNCPHCRQAMDTHVYGGGGNVVMSDCERCGVNWLEHGDLDRIVRAPDRQYTVES